MALVGYSIGSLVHIICDWPYYKGIPLFLPKKRVKGLGLEFGHATNKIIETGVMVGIVVLGGYLALQQ
jgi:hypothetical protein